MQINRIYGKYFAERTKSGASAFVLQGGRRSGKTIAICQRLVMLCYKHRRIVNVATMTHEQGRLGAYADICGIINGEQGLREATTILQSPREVRFSNGSVIFFNSYQNSETAKGVACDYVFLNEANNFTEQQYIDLIANARRGVYIDFNPNGRFWVDKYYSETDIFRTTWKDNPFLTAPQRAYFEQLRQLGTAPDASPVNVRNYKVYYLGEYGEMTGRIFMPDDVVWLDPNETGHLINHAVFCDPSALRGNDSFACVLSAFRPDDGKMVVLDVWSENMGTREDVARKILDWGRRYDLQAVYIETNGIIGVDFYEFCLNSGIDVSAWNSRGNKFERIIARYGDLTERTAYADTPVARRYMEQVFTFAEHCEHDDNVDALASSFQAQKMLNA